MKNLLIMDIKKSIKSFEFLFAVFIFVFCALFNYCVNFKFSYVDIEQIGLLSTFQFVTIFSFSIFSYLAPVIAMLPSGFVFIRNLQSGFLNHEIIRVGIKKYKSEKLVFSLIMGSLVFIIGIVVLLIICWFLDATPSIRITQLAEIKAFQEVYAQSLLKYVLLFALNTAVFGAVYSVFMLGLSATVKNIYIAFLIPVSIYVISTLTYGSLYGIGNLLPFNTFIFYSTTEFLLVKDHIMIFIVGVTLFHLGFKRMIQI